jgi:hypothetical protein
MARTMKRVSIKGFVVGGIVDIVSTNILGAVVLVAVVACHLVPVSGTDPQRLTQALLASPGITAALLLAGAMASVFGGYVAARLAKHDELLNGALSAWLCVSFSVFSMITVGAGGRLLLDLVMLPISPCLGLLGGYLHLTLRRRATPQPV